MSKQKTHKLLIAAIAALIVSAAGPTLVGNAHAISPQFAKVFVRLNRLHEGEVTGGSVCAKTPASGVGSEAFVDVGFPTQAAVTNNFALGLVGTWTANTNGDPDTIGATGRFWPNESGVTTTAWPGIGSGALSVDSSNKIVRFASTALSASTWYCFNFGAALQNADAGFIETSPGFVATYDNTGTNTTPGSGVELMRTNWATATYGVDGTYNLPLDQIKISAIVPPLFQFDLSNTVDFVPATGNLNYQTINESGGVTVTVHTNAKQGWVAWSKSANQGLKSASAGNYTIGTVPWNTAAPTVITATTQEKYGLAVFAPAGAPTSTCTPAVAPEYDVTTNTNQVGAMPGNFQEIGSCVGGTSDGDFLTLKERVVIKSVTPAATDYTDTLTVVGAGTF
jgi:hypothetical protein